MPYHVTFFSPSLVQDASLQYQLEHKGSEFGANTCPVLSDGLNFPCNTLHECFLFPFSLCFSCPLATVLDVKMLCTTSEE